MSENFELAEANRRVALGQWRCSYCGNWIAKIDAAPGSDTHPEQHAPECRRSKPYPPPKEVQIANLGQLDGTPVTVAMQLGNHHENGGPRIIPADPITAKLVQDAREQLAKNTAVETVNEPKHDPVNHPQHYTSLGAKCSHCGTPIECIDVVEHMGFRLGNAVKYLWRVEAKDDPITNIRKAIWYLTREIAARIAGSK